MDEGGTASLEEERRLAYVAITRARRRAHIFHAANRRIYGQWMSSIPSRFIAELPDEHIDVVNTMGGGASMWRANWSAQGDPFAHVAERKPAREEARGPAWQRAKIRSSTVTRSAPPSERGPAASVGAKARSDLAIGSRVFHEKFGYGTIEDIDGNKLEVEFEQAGAKRVLDSFIKLA
jgi:DNA helicase II / ATP-dependent DNA helicase PcrA